MSGLKKKSSTVAPVAKLREKTPSTVDGELDPRVQRFLRFMAASALESLMREQEEKMAVREDGPALQSDDQET